jgi:ATP-utilising chromatin assembly and remodelling N-terminal.
MQSYAVILLVLCSCKFAIIEPIVFCREFCQRVILCNSLVWCCSLTGKPQLTYQEALQSEENARVLIKTFPRKVIHISNLKQLLHF